MVDGEVVLKDKIILRFDSAWFTYMEGALSLTRQASATEMAYRETLARISSNVEVVEQVDFEHVLTTDVRVVAKAFSPQKTN